MKVMLRTQCPVALTEDVYWETANDFMTFKNTICPFGESCIQEPAFCKYIHQSNCTQHYESAQPVIGKTISYTLFCSTSCARIMFSMRSAYRYTYTLIYDLNMTIHK